MSPEQADDALQAADAIRAAVFTDDGLRPESLFALMQAAVAASTDGIGGALILKLPRKKGAPVDIQFTTGSAGIKLEM